MGGIIIVYVHSTLPKLSTFYCHAVCTLCHNHALLAVGIKFVLEKHVLLMK